MAQSSAGKASGPRPARRRHRQKPAKPADEKPMSGAWAGVDALLDEGLEETFPASDPVSINPGAD
ncbi:MAG TPA: hypothetical protein VGN38_01010 [Caulobacteraceae bacterium]|jgi:hypothetical protein|nr:hypothetical protein [Caulobacteraceae bacterium]